MRPPSLWSESEQMGGRNSCDRLLSSTTGAGPDSARNDLSVDLQMQRRIQERLGRSQFMRLLDMLAVRSGRNSCDRSRCTYSVRQEKGVAIMRLLLLLRSKAKAHSLRKMLRMLLRSSFLKARNYATLLFHSDFSGAVVYRSVTVTFC